jgi:MerR family transcriptional regulator, light-induced transcriptional regulator
MNNEGMHPIGVVAERAGLTPDLIRMWERRYGVVEPVRDAAGRRVYSNADVQRLRLLSQASAAGRNIGQLATLPAESLAALVQGDERARWQANRPPDVRHGAGEVVEQALARTRALDGPGLDGVLRRAYSSMGVTALLEDVVGPFFRRVGDAWHAGQMTPAHEHLASGVVRPFLSQVRTFLPVAPGAPSLVVAAPTGDRHEVGALIVAATAAVEGWSVVYLGADLPAADMALSARDVGARAVAVSAVYVPDPALLAAELLTLRAALPDGVGVLVGGAAAAHPSVVKVLEQIGAARADDLPSLRAYLRDGAAEAA